MLQNAYFFAKIGADTAENEQHFAENLAKIGNYQPLAGPREDRRGLRLRQQPPPGPAGRAGPQPGAACGQHPRARSQAERSC